MRVSTVSVHKPYMKALAFAGSGELTNETSSCAFKCYGLVAQSSASDSLFTAICECAIRLRLSWFGEILEL